MSQRIAVADIGGTHARFALAEIGGGRVETLGDPIVLKTADYVDLPSAWREFGKIAAADLPGALAIAIAGPAEGETLSLTNNRWTIRRDEIQEGLNVAQCKIVNDFGAIAHAVAQFDDDRFDHLCGPVGPIPPLGITSVVGPGTGLGVAQLIRTHGAYHVIATEGGHIDFAPLDPLEDRILAHLRRKFGRVSVERIASGSGLTNLYDALASIEGGEAEVEEGAIWTAALENSDPRAVAAFDRFFLTLGSVAGDIALVHGSNAVVIAGGLGFRLRESFATSGFIDRFRAKGRFRGRMEGITVKLLNHPEPGLYGAAAAFAQEFA